MGCGASSPVADYPSERPDANRVKAFVPESDGNSEPSPIVVHATREARAEKLRLEGWDDENDQPQPPRVQQDGTARQRRMSTPDLHMPPVGLNDLVEEEVSPVPVTKNEGKPRISIVHAQLSMAGQEPQFDANGERLVNMEVAKTNQDSCAVSSTLGSTLNSLCLCFDGHGPVGHRVSRMLKTRLPQILLKKRSLLDSNPAQAMSESFLEVDAELTASEIDTEFSGSTAVACFLRGTTLTTAWTGDSRAVLGREKNGRMMTIPLTTDHKPDMAEERERIDLAGGRIAKLVNDEGEEVGPNRVWLRYAWIPGLAMSRSLGDSLAHQVGVSSEPEVNQREIEPSDRFLILASDGVWEFVTDKEAVDIVAACDSPEEAAKKLVEESRNRWILEEDGVIDDITAVVVAFSHREQDSLGGGGAAVAVVEEYEGVSYALLPSPIPE